MKDVVDLFGAMAQMQEDYQSRTIARDEIGGLIVSTASTPDCGDETAIIDANGAHPVQRYENRAYAEEGHAAWVAKIKLGLRTITKLGWRFLVADVQIELEPRQQASLQ